MAQTNPLPLRRLAQRPVRHALAAAAALAASLACSAQTAPAEPSAPTATPATPTPPTDTARQATSTVTVRGQVPHTADLLPPAHVLAGDQLVTRRGTALGDTLGQLPGVSSSYFGPHADRPVIRGQDGDRIRLLGNGGASLDASSLSYDHAVPIDPLAIERIEVLRGPAALLYGGGSAVGGVVNTIDNRIPKAPVPRLGGAAELRLGGAANERGTAALVEAGGTGFALHADAFDRRTDDVRVPAFAHPADGEDSAPRRRMANSSGHAQGGALGASVLWAQGHLGASVDTYRNTYGSVAEEGVRLHMRRDRLAVSGEQRALPGPVATLRLQASATDYQHQEVAEDGTVGTTFKNRGGDLRLEAVQAPRPLAGGVLNGVFGLQAEWSRFAALGEEAFVPTTHSRQAAAFVQQQWQANPTWRWDGALRVESLRVRSDGDGGDAADSAEAGRFGPAATRRFTPASASVGAQATLAPGWQWTSTLSLTARAPTSYELFANGVHAATGTYERGDTAQRQERGRTLETALQWRQGAGAGPAQFKAGVYASRFSNYIALSRTGEPDHVTDEGDTVPVYAFRGVRAQLWGLEVEGRTRLWQGSGQLDLEAGLDLVRGDDLSHGQPLPRLAPRRVSAALVWQQDGWLSRLELQQVAAQTRVPSDDSATPGHTLVHLGVSKHVAFSGYDALVYLRLNNLGNRLAYNAGSIATMRWLAPLPGRALSAGLRLAF